eukprot:TRINITY_DN1671_c0_g1_i2.p1 TRINITY_DN1671_c0_g1~~TRINITY_DN1671_c0_g1_i2.p1  ORF type:complete len:2092 (+),score=1058.04 TRINITY_DN1671_c0_g1_i2:861-7136(+)
MKLLCALTALVGATLAAGACSGSRDPGAWDSPMRLRRDPHRNPGLHAAPGCAASVAPAATKTARRARSPARDPRRSLFEMLMSLVTSTAGTPAAAPQRAPLSARGLGDDADITPLAEGVIVEANATAGMYRYFSVSDLAGTGPIIISVTAMSGDPDLFVSATEHHPTASTPDTVRSQDLGGEELTIDDPVAGPYYIGVYAFGWSPSRFTITVTRQDYLPLESGQPSSGTIAANVDRFYKLDYPSNLDHVTIVLTAPTYWGMRLYVNGIAPADGSSPYYVPGQPGASYQWHSSYDLPRRVIATSQDDAFCKGVPADPVGTCSLFITVHGSSYMVNETLFTITAATAGTTVHLQPGATVYDVVPRLNEDYFDIYIDRDADISVSLTALSGNPNLYISASDPQPGPLSSDWHSSFYGTDSIEIPRTDPKFCYNCWLYIGVGGTANAYFYLTAGYSGNFTDLVPGAPMTGAAEPGETKHYRLYAEGSHPQDIEFTVTGTHGATPSLRIGRTSFPERINADWSDIGWTGTARKVIRKDEALACINCYYYISISEYNANAGLNFTILAAPSSETVVLQDGVPQTGQVARGEYAYFSIELNLVQNLTINLSPSSGDPDLYVSTQSGTRRPTNGNSTWHSANYFSDEITIATTDRHFCSPCRYFIGVYGYQASTFTIVASHADSTVEVTPGEVYSVTSAAGEWRSYQVEVGQIEDHITFSVSPTSGWPHVYISTSPNPNGVNHTWSTAGYPAVQRIATTDAGFCQQCSYYISVGSRYTKTTYTLTVSIADEGVALQPGIPTFGEIQSRGMAYYRIFFSDASQDILIDLTAYGGDPDLFVSTTQRHPGPLNHTWSAIAFGGDRVLIRHQGDDNYCSQCFYYIGVRSYQTDRVRFTITASESDGTLLLHQGTPLQDSISASEVRKIILSIDLPTPRITVSITPSRGVPSLYMSTSDFPDAGNSSTYDWESRHGNPVIITATEGDKGWCKSFPCDFYFLVTPREGSDSGLAYTIQASGSSRTVTLITGRAQVDSAPPHRYRYYRFYPSSDDDIRVTVSAIEGDPDLYVSTTNPYPAVGNATWSSARYGDDSVIIRATATDRCQGPTCIYYVGVRSFSSTRPCTYTITVTQSKIVTDILNGVPHGDVVDADGSMLVYRLHVSSMVQDHITFAVTPRDGIPDLYVSSVSPAISAGNRTSYGWRATHGAPVALSVHPGEPGFCTGCDYFIGVAAHANSTAPVSFALLASASNDSVTLRPGSPQIGTVSPFSYSYYQISFETEGTVIISVTALAGRNEDPDLFVSCSNDIPRPTNARHTWAGQFWGADTIRIAPTHPKYCRGEGNKFVIGVTDIIDFSSRGEVVSFLISAHLEEGGWVDLQAGLPQSGAVAAGSPQRFRFHVDADGESSSEPISSVTITMIPSTLGASDSVTVYVGSQSDATATDDPPTFPAPGNATTYALSATAEPTARLVIERGAPGFCVGCSYLITVDGSSAIEFTLSAQTSSEATVLQTGVPFQGQTRPGQTAIFMFAVLRLTGDVTISATPLAGDAAMMVEVVDHEDDNLWLTGSIALSGGTLTIPQSEVAAFCTQTCRFRIRVQGTGTPAEPGSDEDDSIPFIITATLADDTITLTPGDPLEVSFAGSPSRRFRVIVPSGRREPLTITAVSPVGVSIDANPNTTSSAGTNYPADTGMGRWHTNAPGTPNYLFISAPDLETVTSVFIRVATEQSSGNSSVLITAAFESSLVQLREGIAGFVAVDGKDKTHVGRFKATFADAGRRSYRARVRELQAREAQNTAAGAQVVAATSRRRSSRGSSTVTSPSGQHLLQGATGLIDKVIFAQAYSGSADIYASINEDPTREKHTNQWAMSVAPGENGPGPRADILIAAGEDPCGTGRCKSVFVSAFPQTEELLTLAVTAAQKGDFLQGTASVKYVVSVKPGDDWAKFRYDAFFRSRDVAILTSIVGGKAMLVYTFEHAVPPPSTDPLPAGYTALTTDGSVPVTIPASKPLYLFVGPVPGDTGTDQVTVSWMVNAPSVDPTPAPSSPSDGPHDDKGKGMSSKTVAILAIASVFGLVFLVGCCVFVSRMDNIRRLYQGRSKSHYSEVMS